MSVSFSWDVYHLKAISESQKEIDMNLYSFAVCALSPYIFKAQSLTPAY